MQKEDKHWQEAKNITVTTRCSYTMATLGYTTVTYMLFTINWLHNKYQLFALQWPFYISAMSQNVFPE